MNAQALDFLQEGKSAKESAPESSRSVPTRTPPPGFELALAVPGWSADDRKQLRRLLLQKYRRDLENAGVSVTKEGLIDPPRNHAPTTRGLDKEMRLMRREMAFLSEITRNLLNMVTILSGGDPGELKEFMVRAMSPQGTSPGAEPEESDDDGGRGFSRGASNGPSSVRESRAHAEEEAAPRTPLAPNRLEPAAARGAAERDPDRIPREDSRSAGSPPSYRRDAVPEAPRYSEKPRKRVALRDDDTVPDGPPPGDRSPPERAQAAPVTEDRSPSPEATENVTPETDAATQVCPRCSREIPAADRRCLFCGKSLA